MSEQSHLGGALDRPEGLVIRPMAATDAYDVRAIYQESLETGQASFETAAPTWEAFDAAKLKEDRHVAVDPGAGTLLGWVAVSAVSSRPVYYALVEHSVYVHLDHQRRGVGAALLAALIRSTEDAGIWTV